MEEECSLSDGGDMAALASAYLHSRREGKSVVKEERAEWKRNAH